MRQALTVAVILLLLWLLWRWLTHRPIPMLRGIKGALYNMQRRNKEAKASNDTGGCGCGDSY